MPPYDPAGARGAARRRRAIADGTASARSRSSPTAAATTRAIVDDARGEPGRHDRLRHDGLRDLPGAAGDGPAAASGASPGSPTTRAPTTSWASCWAPARPRTRVAGRRPTFDAAIADATSAADPAAATAAYARAMGIVRDQVPAVPVSYGTSFSLVRDGLLGASQNGLGILRLAGPRVGGRPMSAAARCASARASRRALVALALVRRAARRALRGRRLVRQRPSAVADYGKAITFTVDVTPRRAARAGRAAAALPGHARAAHRGRARARRHGHRDAAVRPRPHRRRTHRAQHADRGHLGGVHRRRAPTRSSSRTDRPLRGHDARLEDAQGRPRDRPLVRGRRGVRQQGARDRRAGGHATRRRCSGSPRPSRSTSSSTATRPRSATALGPGHARERRRPGPRRHPDAVRADQARARSTSRGSASSSRTSSSTSCSTPPSTTPTGSRRGG